MLSFKKQGELIFYLPNGEKIIDIEIADTHIKRTIGLMLRETMQPDRGMLFVMESEDIQSFWMHKTYLSLDLLYVDREKQVIDIYPNTMPFSTDSLESTAPALYVVEVNAGFCKEHGITVGTYIDWIYINNQWG